MPDHIRKQIRDAAAVLVTGLTTTGANVFENRVHPVEDSKLPALLIYTEREDSEPDTMTSSGRSMARALDLVIEGVAEANTALDDTLDLITVEVETAMAADKTFSNKAKDSWLTGTEIELSGKQSHPVGMVRLTYRVEYRTSQADPTIAQ